LGLNLFSIFSFHHILDQVYLLSLYFIFSQPWSAIKKTTSPEEERNPTTPALDQDPAMKMRARASHDPLIKPHVGTWDTAILSDAQESD
jgi:hypothetical protein